MPLSAGTRLGPYEIVAPVGAGGMGEVYKARDTRLGRTVAIKISTDQFSERFEREARAVAALNHPHICQLYDVGPNYLVMEYVEGAPIRPTALQPLLDLAVQIADGLTAAHSAGIVHRDLKPSNILVTPSGQVKILDFGLATVAAGSTDVADAMPTMAVTDAGTTVGTVAYMSPEQARGQAADTRSDLWSLGVVLYEMATGVRPFDGPTAPVVFEGLLSKAPVPVRVRNPNIPVELERTIAKCLEKDRDLRYQHASDIRADLQRLKRDTGSERAITSAPGATRSIATRWKLVAAAAAALVLAFGVAGYVYVHRTPTLTEKDAIVLADFTNTTGDPVFDGALRQGLSVQLEQTPFLRVISGDQITRTLMMMERPLDARLTPALAREICQRTNATVEIEGSIATLGNQYVLGLNAVNCATGDTLGREQVTADGKEKVLPALSHAASALRSKLGESRASLKTYNVPLTQATTSSLEALQAYNQGGEALWKSDFPSAVSALQHAVDLDPNFASAYSVLANLANTDELAAKHITRAYDLRDRTSAYEKLAISATYHFLVTRDLEKAAQFWQQWTTTYPRDPAAWFGLLAIDVTLGRYDQALAAGAEAVRLNPSSLPYGWLAWSYMLLNRFGEARATIQQARARHIEPFLGAGTLYGMSFLENDQPGMTEQLAHPWADAPPGAKEDVQSDTAAYSGHLKVARDLTRRAVASATSAQAGQVAAGFQVKSAVREALFGNPGEARNTAKEASRLSQTPDVQGAAALALALAGDAAEARTIADDLSQRFPAGTLVRFFHLPAIHAALALQLGNPHGAIESLNIAASHELVFYGFAMMPVYVRGEAHLAAHEGIEAAAEFQKILHQRGVVVNAPIGALAHLGLGRAYALAGDMTKARLAYQDFLALWKDADPDIPVFQQAKAEYARLQ